MIQNIDISQGVSPLDGKPYVILRYGPGDSYANLTPALARQVATVLFMAAAVADCDAELADYLKSEVGASPDAARHFLEKLTEKRNAKGSTT